MREDTPSNTAAAVAFARGVASLPSRSQAPSPDLLAARMLPPRLGRVLDGLSPLARRTGVVSLALRYGSLGLVDHVALRTAAIDRALGDACRAGVSQVVILGAGLDARAWRLTALSGLRVFEVDHPATQRLKRSRAEGLDPHAGEIRFVPVDFAREDLGARLGEEGHDPDQPTIWIWEGVTMYLSVEAMCATLDVLARRSPPGSTLAVTYHTESDRFWLSRIPTLVHLAFEMLGEPLVNVMSSERFGAFLGDAGWNVAADTGPRDWRRRYRFGGLLTIGERLVVAERQ